MKFPPFLVESISQNRFVCHVWCSSIQGIYAQFTGGSISQSRFICQVLCTGIQGISALLPGGSFSQSRFICQVLCTGIQGISALVMGGSISQCRFVCQVWCCSIQGIYFWLPGWGSISQSMFVCQVWCSSIQGIYSWLPGGPSAKVGSSAKFGVAVFKASVLNSLGGSISQSMFICQVLCTGIQGKYQLSELKSLIGIWGCFGEHVGGITSEIPTFSCRIHQPK